MFEISQLNEKKLSELQEIAQKLNVPKYRSLKKSDLVYQILDHQATNPTSVAEVLKPESTTTENIPAPNKPVPNKPAENRDKKPRARIKKPSNNPTNKTAELPFENKASEIQKKPTPAVIEKKVEEKSNSDSANKTAVENKPRDVQKNHPKREHTP
ncbi:MAG: transcription termination factor Rho, partial [Flavobacteriales bacterium]|nr:transcription termination factor Rho [Flavobacteriales bacterium]